VLHVDNPEFLPDASVIQEIREPIVKCFIMVPNEYISPLMQLILDKRGLLDHTETLDTRRVMLTCVLPLNEILVDFNDKIKSITRGYGSMDYEHAGYRTAKLVKLDILVNNAAYQMAQPGGIEDITTEQFDRVLKTNLYAMFWLSKYAVPHMTKGASIINTSSVQAASPSPELLDYATTKAGIVNFTRGLATMISERGIRVNSVAPGPIWTPLIPATMPEEKVATFGEQTPLGRAGQPAELAPAYVFLASEDASYITGEVIAVTGGMPVSI